MDSNDLFRYLDKEKIASAIKIRKNATTDHCKGSKRRRTEIRSYQRWGYELWSHLRRYGLRWAIEGIFSAVKRKFGENILAKSEKTMRAEAVQRFWSYDTVRNYGLNGIGIVG